MLFNFPKKNIRKFGKSPARLIVDETFGVDAELKKLVEPWRSLFFYKIYLDSRKFCINFAGQRKGL